MAMGPLSLDCRLSSPLSFVHVGGTFGRPTSNFFPLPCLGVAWLMSLHQHRGPRKGGRATCPHKPYIGYYSPGYVVLLCRGVVHIKLSLQLCLPFMNLFCYCIPSFIQHYSYIIRVYMLHTSDHRNLPSRLP